VVLYEKIYSLFLTETVVILPIQSFASPTSKLLAKKQNYVYEDSNEAGKPSFEIVLEDK
jgi:hypothetical protein